MTPVTLVSSTVCVTHPTHCFRASFIQAEYLQPHLHGVVAFFNFVLVRLDYFDNSAKGRLVSNLLSPLCLKLQTPNLPLLHARTTTVIIFGTYNLILHAKS